MYPKCRLADKNDQTVNQGRKTTESAHLRSRRVKVSRLRSSQGKIRSKSHLLTRGRYTVVSHNKRC